MMVGDNPLSSHTQKEAQNVNAVETLAQALADAIKVLDGNGFANFAAKLQATLDSSRRDIEQAQEAGESWEREQKDLRKWSAVLSEAEDYDTAREQVQEDMGEPLDVSTEKVIQVLLTTGGPARGYTLFVDSDGEATRGYYWYQNWYTDKRVYWLDTQELADVVAVYDIYTGD
jgi:hypothetical protein